MKSMLHIVPGDIICSTIRKFEGDGLELATELCPGDTFEWYDDGSPALCLVVCVFPQTNAMPNVKVLQSGRLLDMEFSRHVWLRRNNIEKVL